MRFFFSFADQSSVIDAATATVRDHIEKVVESLVGENLDMVNIVRLSTQTNCKYLQSPRDINNKTNQVSGRDKDEKRSSGEINKSSRSESRQAHSEGISGSFNGTNGLSARQDKILGFNGWSGMNNGLVQSA